MPKLLFDFADPRGTDAWYPIDDRVMGGASRSRLRHDAAGHAVFEGVVSLEHNGGFASVRSKPGEHGLAGAESCLIELRGDARQYQLSLLVDDAFDTVGYRTGFAPAGSDWQTLRLPLAGFRASARGREVPGAPPLEPAHIRQLGLMIKGKRAGPFALDIRRISLA